MSDDNLNIRATVLVSPSRVVLGHQVKVTITIVNQGGEFDRSILMFSGGSDPSDSAADASPPCSTDDGGFQCPITDLRPGGTSSYSYSFIPGPFPGTDGFDDPVGVTFDYTDSHGQQQQTQQFVGHVMLFNPPASSPPPTTGSPSNATPSPVPVTPAASDSATPAPSSTR